MGERVSNATPTPDPAAGQKVERCRLSRRLVVLALSVPACMRLSTAARAQDLVPAQLRTGMTDADFSDRADFGRGSNQGRPRTGLTDRDPTDYRGYGLGPHSGTTDTDPADSRGRGRGEMMRDADPVDPTRRRPRRL